MLPFATQNARLPIARKHTVKNPRAAATFQGGGHIVIRNAKRPPAGAHAAGDAGASDAARARSEVGAEWQRSETTANGARRMPRGMT